MPDQTPSLFGLKKTNRDFTKKDTWGKNQFNSSFPASLCCYLENKGLRANYLSIQQQKFVTSTISIEDAFGISTNNKDAFFAFEAQYTPFQKYVVGTLPRTDLVMQRESTGECLSALEIKLTALPDNTTSHLSDELYGSEIVVRPDTIVYLACSIAASLGANLNNCIPNIQIIDWSNPKHVLPHMEDIVSCIKKITIELEKSQSAILVQPIWKTNGKTPELSENCLDVFIWSNAGLNYFIAEIANSNTEALSITRQTRTAIWLFKMLYDVKEYKKFNASEIIDTLSYNTKNDKAFAVSGMITNKYMVCERLKKPIITKNEIKKIILGGGHNMLSPERRFDAIIFNSPELFK